MTEDSEKEISDVIQEIKIKKPMISKNVAEKIEQDREKSPAKVLKTTFKCQECKYEEDFPMHRGYRTDLGEDRGDEGIYCTSCGQIFPIPKHHDKEMKVYVYDEQIDQDIHLSSEKN